MSVTRLKAELVDAATGKADAMSGVITGTLACCSALRKCCERSHHGQVIVHETKTRVAAILTVGGGAAVGGGVSLRFRFLKTPALIRVYRALSMQIGRT